MVGVVRRTLRCTRAERAQIGERAAALGMPVSGYLIACALREDAGGSRSEEPRLVLSEDEQRALYDRVLEMDRVRRALHEQLPGTRLSLFGADRPAAGGARVAPAGGREVMPVQRMSPRVRISISCLESEWERIREVADRRGVSINDHVISAGLSVELGPTLPDAPALVLNEEEQRRLLEQVDRLAESMLSGAAGGSIEQLRQSVEVLLMTMLEDMVRQGREEELLPLLEKVFGEEDAGLLEMELRGWTRG